MKERDCQEKKETHCQEAILGGHSSNEKLERAGLDCSFLSGSQWGTGTQYSSTQALTALPRSNPSSNYIPFLPEVTLSHTLHRKWYPSCITTFRPLKLFIQGRSTKTILPLTKSKSFISNPKRRDVLYYLPDLSDCVTTFCPTKLQCLHFVCTFIRRGSGYQHRSSNMAARGWLVFMLLVFCFSFGYGKKKVTKEVRIRTTLSH